MIKKSKRIPTLFALTLLAIALGLAIGIDLYQKKIDQNLKALYAPKKLSIINISDGSLSLTWQTNIPTSGQVIYGLDQNLSESTADIRGDSKYISHYVTLTKLLPNQTYYYKIKSEDKLYPQNPLQIKTGPLLNFTNKTTPPLVGTIVDSSLNPIEDALIYLEVSGASRLGTYATTGGNFIIPLTTLRTKDLVKTFDLTEPSKANLVILKGTQSSKYNISLSNTPKSLPALILGQNLDLTNFQETPTPQALPSQTVKYDLNGDFKINSLDLLTVSQAIGKLPVVKKADLNDDGRVDKKDMDLIQKEIR